VEGIIRQVIAAVQASEGTVVVELSCDAACRHFLVIRAEVPTITRISKQWQLRSTSRRCHTNDACQRIRTIQRTVWFSQHLNLLNARRGKIRKFDRAADIVHRHIIDQHLVRIGIAPANRQRRGAPKLAGLRHLQSRNLTQWLVHFRVLTIIVRRQHGHGGADLRDRSGSCRRCHRDLLRQGLRGQCHIQFRLGGFRNVDRVARRALKCRRNCPDTVACVFRNFKYVVTPTVGSRCLHDSGSI
jgi:hypothetical protein